MQQRGVEQRERILDAALEILMSSGMGAVTHRGIAGAADVALGAIRYYFRTREELLLACLTTLEQARDRAARDVLAEIDTAGLPVPPHDAAQKMLRVYYGDDLSDRLLLGTLGAIVDSAREASSLAALLLAQRKQIDIQLGVVLRASGSDADVTIAAAVIDGAIVSAMAEGRSAIAEEIIALLEKLLDTASEHR